LRLPRTPSAASSLLFPLPHHTRFFSFSLRPSSLHIFLPGGELLYSTRSFLYLLRFGCQPLHPSRISCPGRGSNSSSRIPSLLILSTGLSGYSPPSQVPSPVLPVSPLVLLPCPPFILTERTFRSPPTRYAFPPFWFLFTNCLLCHLFCCSRPPSPFFLIGIPPK